MPHSTLRSWRCFTLGALLLTCATVVAEDSPKPTFTLGEDVVPGWVIAANQVGRWATDSTVEILVTLTDDAGGPPLATAVTVQSGAPELAAAAAGPVVSGRAGTPIAYPVDAATAEHTALFVTLEDASGNRMTSRFTLIR